jgi:hypothetical protein
MQKFENSVQELGDAPWPGVLCLTVLWKQNIKFRKTTKVTLDDLSMALSSVQKELGFRKVCKQWMPCQLTCEVKQMYLNTYRALLAKCDSFLGQIVTGDESWVHYFQTNINGLAQCGVILRCQSPKISRKIALSVF